MCLTAVLLALFASEPNHASEHNSRAIAFVCSLQTPSGGFVTIMPNDGTKPSPSLRTTRTALRCLRYLGGQPADRDAVIRYLLACYHTENGGFSDSPKVEPDSISTAVALMIFGELKLPVDHYLEGGLRYINDNTVGFEQVRMVASALEELRRTVPNAQGWLREIQRERNADGSYGRGPGTARTTALHVVTELRLGGAPPSREAVLKVLRDGQRADGGFGGDAEGSSDLEACYRIVRVLTWLDSRPRDPGKLRAFIAHCRNSDGGYSIRPNTPSSLHGTYYATIVRYWLDH